MKVQQKTQSEGASAKPGGGELALIQHIRSRAGVVHRGGVRLGIGDDCAILRARPGEEIVVTTDLSLEGRHFRRDWHPAASIGHRALARGLSDIAAMGARPLAAFLSLALPAAVARDSRWIDGFLDGLLGLAKRHGVPLAGGDTSEAPGDAVIADIVLLGAAPAGLALRRSGTRAGDILYCTGALGGASAELERLSANPGRFKAAKTGPHLFPEPRLAVGQALLRRRLATACIDLSDGLSTDLDHLCEASGLSAMIEARALPLHPSTCKLAADKRLLAALHGGEDYELLFTARPSTRMPKTLDGVAITRIGQMIPSRLESPRAVLVDDMWQVHPLPPQGWEHFRGA
jgi:thiamine-monophosphate kinase